MRKYFEVVHIMKVVGKDSLEAFREHSGNIRGTFRERSGKPDVGTEGCKWERREW